VQRTLTSSEEVGDLVAAERLAQGVTQEELAGLAGVSPSFLGDLEAGKPTAELRRTLLVLSALGLTLAVDIGEETARNLGRNLGRKQGSRRRVATSGRAASKASR